MDLAMDDFISIMLSRLPYLRALSLNDSFSETLEVSEAVPVPNLETLELTASSMRCSCFLRAVWIPKCRIVLNVPYRSLDLWFLCDTLDSHRADSADPILHGLQIVDLPPAPDGASLFEILFFNHTSGSASPRYTFRLAAGSLSLPNWREEIMYTIMTIISLDQINILTVNCEALKLSTSLLHLKDFRSAAFYRHVEPFTNQLEGDPLMAAGDRFDPINEAVHYPRLRRIVFHHIVFSQRRMAIILDCTHAYPDDSLLSLAPFCGLLSSTRPSFAYPWLSPFMHTVFLSVAPAVFALLLEYSARPPQPSPLVPVELGPCAAACPLLAAAIPCPAPSTRTTPIFAPACCVHTYSRSFEIHTLQPRSTCRIERGESVS
ncbi:hypothetical protein DFH08DRAFT_973703 [Mycena albidolilacea]|uniref:F-box domain-containing protein n=1 Tax=Mycena albidolilacea TaxID=1033008 RepID=A0AAD7ECB8_9AGAR|nr:hypothetical protein DFH08DRAFT_973703 [Mycena albidolilacea]